MQANGLSQSFAGMPFSRAPLQRLHPDLKPRMKRQAIVAGGGIGGVSAALALHRAGIDVTVFERAPAFTEVGAGMSLWPNATRVLASWGVLDQLLSLGEPFSQFNLLKPDGGRISIVSMTGFATPGMCIHRADLHRALRQPLPDRCVAPNECLESFSQDARGVTARFASGLEGTAAYLIGADGINSVVRSQIHGSESPVYRGYHIWRGVAPEVPGIVRGHISETWGSGRRFGILPMGQGRVCWYATRNGPPSKPEDPEARKIDVRNLFKDWHNPIPALIEATRPGDIIKTDARDRKPLRKWGDGRVTLLGDAAHPMTPNVGQGACMAIEDAACLSKCLERHPGAVPALRAYEKMRGPRTAHIARQARRVGAIGQWENPWIVRGRNLVTGLVLSLSPDMTRNSTYAHEV
jgi:2-polyprenyl-6-methoxyphenol hydroxylase-like FAD-dependent oxidoreductase